MQSRHDGLSIAMLKSRERNSMSKEYKQNQCCNVIVMVFKCFKTFIQFTLCLYFTAGGSEAVTQPSGMRSRTATEGIL